MHLPTSLACTSTGMKERGRREEERSQSPSRIPRLPDRLPELTPRPALAAACSHSTPCSTLSPRSLSSLSIDFSPRSSPRRECSFVRQVSYGDTPPAIAPSSSPSLEAPAAPPSLGPKARTTPPPGRPPQRSPSPRAARSYTTVRQGPFSARKLALTAAEQMQYMVTGVRPAPSRRSASVVPLPAAVAARSNASVASTRARAMAVIDERERVVAELHSLLPFPRDEAERTAATRSLLVDPAAAAALRERLASLLRCNGHVNHVTAT